MSSKLSLTFLLVPTLAVALPAQEAPSRIERRDLKVDSGYLDHLGSEPAVIWSRVLRLGGADAIRLYFGPSNLPEGTRLRLSSLEDQAVQYHDGRSLRDYQNSSAVFNGSAVQVELLAAPHSKANRVLVSFAEVELPAVVGGPDTVCGARDRRVPSTDPRAGRLWSIGCTGWIINEFTVITAGHCSGSSTKMIMFNVPLSMSTGAKVNPPPKDQYPLDANSMVRLASGVGKDWGVWTAKRNSNTGLYPGQAQKQWYRLGTVPTSTVGQKIRITGYGAVETYKGVPATWNQAQKTHVDALYSVGSTSLSYRTDTSGGNSGSPVIDDLTGKAIGVHTHGSCSGWLNINSGTRIDRSDFKAAIAKAVNSVTVGTASNFGSACAGQAGMPSLDVAGIPDINNPLTFTASKLKARENGFLFFGISNKIWKGTPLPYDLGTLGMKGCFQRVSLEVAIMLASDSSGTAVLQANLPNLPGLVGASIFAQYAGHDASANAGQTVTTNGVGVFIGG